MKKIIYFLVFLTTFSFSNPCPNEIQHSDPNWTYYAKSAGPIVLYSGQSFPDSIIDTYRIGGTTSNKYCTYYSNEGMESEKRYTMGQTRTYYALIRNCVAPEVFLQTTNSCGIPEPTCDFTTEVDIDGTCEVIGEQGSCDDFNIRGSDGTCSLEIAYYNTIDSGLDSETVYIGYADGTQQIYRPLDGFGLREDKDGNTLPLIPIVGGPYDGITPSSYFDNLISDGIGKTLQVLGLTFFISSTNDTLRLIPDLFNPLDFNPATMTSLESLIIGQSLRTPDTTILQQNTSNADNNPLTSAEIFDGVTLVSTPSSNDIVMNDTTQVPSTTTQDVPVELNEKFDAIKEYSEAYANKWGGVGNLGETVYLPKFSPNVAVTSKDGTTRILHKNADGSVDVVAVQNSSISNSIVGQSNGLKEPSQYNEVPINVSKISAPTIQNDGSIATTTTDISTVTNNPSANLNETTTKNGNTTVTQVPTPINTPSTTPLGGDSNLSVDFTPLTGRLDNISRQLNLLNNTQKGMNSFIQKEPTELEGQGYDEVDMNSTIDSSFIDNFISTFTTAWDNMQTDIASVSDEGTSLITTLTSDRDGGFLLSLPRATVTECPYISQIDFSSLKDGFIVDISVDLCKPFSAVYPIFYILFSIMFTVFIIGFGFKSIMRLV